MVSRPTAQYNLDLQRWMFGDAGDPQLIACLAGEVAVDQVGRRRRFGPGQVGRFPGRPCRLIRRISMSRAPWCTWMPNPKASSACTRRRPWARGRRRGCQPGVSHRPGPRAAALSRRSSPTLRHATPGKRAPRRAPRGPSLRWLRTAFWGGRLAQEFCGPAVSSQLCLQLRDPLAGGGEFG